MIQTKKFQNIKIVTPAKRAGGGSKVPSLLLNLPLDSTIELKEVYKELKDSNYIVKPILKALEKANLNTDTPYLTLDSTEDDNLRIELILEGFFKNLASTGSFCYFRKVIFAYTEELDYHYLIKGAQTNLITFEKGKYDKADKTSPYYKK